MFPVPNNSEQQFVDYVASSQAISMDSVLSNFEEEEKKGKDI